MKYLQNTAWHLTLQLPTCASHVAFSQVLLLASFLQASREIAMIFIACLIFHQLNTKSNIIKFHKIQGNNLLQLQYFLSWNKANIKHSCKLQLYKLIYKNVIFRIYTKGCVRIFEYACAWFNHAYVWHCFRLIIYV